MLIVATKSWTGLMHACENGRTEVVKLFLKYKEQGVDISLFATNNYDKDASMLANDNGHHNIAQLIRDFTESHLNE